MKVITKFKLTKGSQCVIGTLGYDKTRCDPSDWVKTNLWVCASTLSVQRIPLAARP